MSSNPTIDGGGGNNGTGGGGVVSGGGPCGACKFLRRKCNPGCVFAPYFDSDQGAAHFAAVHKVFGASNVSKLLGHIPVHRRHDAVVTVCYEAQARLRDPVFGCVSHIFALQQQLVNLQTELSYCQAHLPVAREGAIPPPPPPPQQATPPPGIPIRDASAYLGAYDMSSLVEPMVPPASWTMQPQMRPMDPRQFMSYGAAQAPADLPQAQGGSGDFQELAREHMQRRGNASAGPGACKTEGSSLRQ
ncbi:LOB domain-containing protein 30-like [Bidens hawaiensis]|uniref:LOB domain-containing protein 30-like n=1 Tax=Bidens hawaiensis TaxID=980011 RepID=UPI00404B8950